MTTTPTPERRPEADRGGSPAAATEAEIQRALARAVLCRALGRGLDEPGRATAAELLSTAAREALEGATRVVEGGAAGPLGAAVADFSRLPPPEPERLARDHHRLLGHTLRGRVCPYGCEYGNDTPLEQAHELADLAGFYRAFGLRPAGDRHERPDHVACQLEYLGFLARKEAHALDRGDGEMLEVTRQAARSFLRRHLGRFGCAFAASLEAAGGGSFYGRLGAVLGAFLRSECGRHGVAAGPEVLELRSDDFADGPMACDSGSDLVQIGDAAGAAAGGAGER